MSAFEPTPIYLFSRLDNFSYELGQIMNRCDFLETRVILSNVQTNSNLT